MSEAELQSFERQLGVALPAEYRHFLLNIGWGAGPFYGLNSPSQVLRDSLQLDYALDPGEPPARNPSAPFPISPADLAVFHARGAAGERHPSITAPFPCDGMIVICNEGCTYWSLLVTAGCYAGTLWTADESTGGQYET